MRACINCVINYFRELKDIRPLAAIIALVTLFIASSTRNPLNNDGILYLQTAEAFANSGWRAAMELYPWPFYSILIAMTAKLMQLSFVHAAYLLNAALLVIIVTSFITIIKELGASRAVQFIGAIVILSHPRLHHYQSYIIRGFGYWAFLLLALLYLIRYHRHLCWGHALGWGTSISIAALFRVEGTVLLIFTPLVLLFRPNIGLWRKISSTLKTYSINIATLFIAQIWCFSKQDMSIITFGRLSEIQNQLQNGFMLLGTNLQISAAIISQNVLNDYSDDFALTMTISGLAGVYLYKLIKTIWPLHTLLCAHAVCNKLIPADDGTRKLLIYFTALNLLIPAIFFGQNFFIRYRFLMPASLLLLIWTPFSLNNIFQDWKNKKRVRTGDRIIFPLLSIAFSIMFVYAFIPSRPSKAYIISAGIWLKNNTPQHAGIYSNTRKIPFYAKRKFILWDIPADGLEQQWTSEDFIALKVGNKDYNKVAKCLTSLNLKLIKVFENKQGDKVIISTVSSSDLGNNAYSSSL